MNRKNSSPFDRDLKQKLEKNPEFAEAYFEELSEETIPVQLALLRRLSGLSQESIAAKLHVRQSYVSRLEKKGSDHPIKHLSKTGRAYGW